MTGPRTVVASAPGKLILMGEHAVVYGCPALVAALGLRARVELGAAAAGVRLELPDLGVGEETGWAELLAYAERARRGWDRYRRQPGQGSFRRMRGSDPAHVVKVALGEAAAELEPGELPPLEVRVGSELPVGSGFGSSAAIAVALLAALFEFLGLPGDDARLERLALEAERRQHGMPSGVDHGTVLRGGVLRAARDEQGGMELAAVPASPQLLSRLAIFDTGRPGESTGEVVAEVRSRRDRDRARFDWLLARMEENVVAFAGELASEGPDPEVVMARIRDYQGCLEAIGVVPSAVRGLVRALEKRGAAAKISGAGSLSEGGAGCLLVYGPDSLEGWSELELFTPYAARLGVEGVRLEGAG